MKNVLSVLLCSLLLISIPLTVHAQEIPKSTVRTEIEVLENGDYIVTIVTQELPLARSNIVHGNKAAVYYNSNGVAIWEVDVNGTFSYNYGTSATATSASSDVYLFSSEASFIRKNAYTSGASAYATATVKYLGTTTTKTVKLTCDNYGNLS